MFIGEFVYNNIKNASIDHTSFELNYKYYLYISFKKDIDPNLRSYSAEKLAKKLRELMSICQQNLFHIQEL